MAIQRFFNGERWRVLTPILLSFITVLTTVALSVIGRIHQAVEGVSQQIFHHLTNYDLHVPRSEYVALNQAITESRKERQAQIEKLQQQLLDTIRAESTRTRVELREIGDHEEPKPTPKRR